MYTEALLCVRLAEEYLCKDILFFSPFSICFLLFAMPYYIIILCFVCWRSSSATFIVLLPFVILRWRRWVFFYFDSLIFGHSAYCCDGYGRTCGVFSTRVVDGTARIARGAWWGGFSRCVRTGTNRHPTKSQMWTARSLDTRNMCYFEITFYTIFCVRVRQRTHLTVNPAVQHRH